MSQDTLPSINGDSDNMQVERKCKKRARESSQDQKPIKKHKTSIPITRELKKDAEEEVMNGSVEHTLEGREHSQSSTTDQPARSIQAVLPFSDQQLQTHSPFVEETRALFLSMSPVAHNFALEGACAEFISPLLLTYYPPVNGVVLSYSNPRLSERPPASAQTINGVGQQRLMGKSIDEYGVTFIWLTVDFLVFRPIIGSILEGYVTLQNESILGLLCYNYFNAGIDQERLPEDWKWVEDEQASDVYAFSKRRAHATGHYENGAGSKVEGRILFKVKDFETTLSADGSNGSINIYGTLLQDDDDDDDDRP